MIGHASVVVLSDTDGHCKPVSIGKILFVGCLIIFFTYDSFVGGSVTPHTTFFKHLSSTLESEIV